MKILLSFYIAVITINYIFLIRYIAMPHLKHYKITEKINLFIYLLFITGVFGLFTFWKWTDKEWKDELIKIINDEKEK